MHVELIYDKRNVDGLPNARAPILAKLEKHVHRVFPQAEVNLKPMSGDSRIQKDATKNDRAKLTVLIEEMFEEADMWLVNDA